LSRVRLGDIADIELGKMLDAEKNKGDLHPYLANVNVRWGSFDLDDLPLMRFEDDETERFLLRPGDLVMCEGGEPGRCAIWRGEVSDVRYQKALHRIRPHENVDVRWLYYWFLLQGRMGGLNQYINQTTIKHLVREDLKNVQIDLPTLDEQRRIAGVLSAIDDKIENNRKLMAELEATARLVYDEWFVRFDFPDEQGRPYRSSGGKMIWNDQLKREIPAGWRCGCLADFSRYSDKKIEALQLDERNFVSADNMVKNYGGLVDSDYVPSEGSVVAFEKGDTLFSNIRPYFKKICIAPFDGGCSADILALKPLGDSSRAFVYLTLTQEWFIRAIVTGAKGSKMPRGDKDLIMALLFAAPPMDLLSEFQIVMSPFVNEQSAAEMENRRLSSLRNWLLPMLMNGQANVG
jgi:type I restriction enzyme S subunit